MRAHQPTRVARTLAKAESLGHEQTDARPSAEHLERGIHFAVTGRERGVVCWVGLCGDPEPGFQLVKYTDADGLCNIFRKKPC
jgi:hypothetical protein